MADLFDYLLWRGDLSFAQVPPNAVDALIFSALSYIRFGADVESSPDTPILLSKAFEDLTSLPDFEDRIRVKKDLELLEAVSQSPRFSNCKIYQYRDILIREEETQFAAITFLLDDGSSFLAFRGTDYTLTGWKEDFNMSFQDTIPAQRLALEYTLEISQNHLMPLRLGGHSKGGNLSMFAAIHAPEVLRKRILGVYNHDGPGFREYVTENPAYLEMVPRLHTYVPQSSVIGMLLEHEEPYTVVKSKQVGILQHEFYSWELDGPDFVTMEQTTWDSRFVDQTIKNWLNEMSISERDAIVDAIFDLLQAGESDNVFEILHPKNIRNYIRILSNNGGMRQVMSEEFLSLLDAARRTQQQLMEKK